MAKIKSVFREKNKFFVSLKNGESNKQIAEELQDSQTSIFHHLTKKEENQGLGRIWTLFLRKSK